MDVDNKKENSLNIGKRLIEARDNLDLTCDDIASRLNLATEVIVKIDKNDFNQDIPTAFVRGYIKSYATQVGLDTGPMLKEFDRLSGVIAPSLSRVQSISTFSTKRKELRSSHLLFKIVSILILLVFLSLAGWELWKRIISPVTETQQSTNANLDLNSQGKLPGNGNQIALEINESDNTSIIEEKIDNNQTVNNQTSSLSDIEQENSSNEVMDNSSQVSGTQASLTNTTNLLESDTDIGSDLSMTSLVLDFSSDCWVKITDARGEVIALGVKKSGKHMPVEGVRPFNVILGDPSVVIMKYAGQSYDLTSYRAGRTANIILN